MSDKKCNCYNAYIYPSDCPIHDAELKVWNNNKVKLPLVKDTQVKPKTTFETARDEASVLITEELYGVSEPLNKSSSTHALIVKSSDWAREFTRAEILESSEMSVLNNEVCRINEGERRTRELHKAFINLIKRFGSPTESSK